MHISKKPYWLLVFGVCAGLGLAAKYTGLFLGAGFVLWLLWTRKNRLWFKSIYLYLGGVIALIVFAPVILWNLDNDLSSLKFQFGRSSDIAYASSIKLNKIAEFFGVQMGLMLPMLFAALCIGIYLFFRKREWRLNPSLGILVLTALPMLIYFLVHATHSRVQGNWPWLLYGQFAILGAYVVTSLQPKNIHARNFMRLIYTLQFPVGLVLTMLICAHAVFGFVRLPFYEHTRDMHGWPEIAIKLDQIANTQNTKMLATFDYTVTGWLASYSKFGDHGLTVLPTNQAFRYGFMPRYNDTEIQWPILAVTRARLQKDGSYKDRILPKTLQPHMQLIEKIARYQPSGDIDDYLYIYRFEKPEAPLFKTAE